jgi:hypothetical protein
MKKTLKQLIRLATAVAIDRGGESAALRLAHEKRAMERRFRKEGCSHKEAARLTWEQFHK